MYEIYPNIDIAICIFGCKTNKNVIAVTDTHDKNHLFSMAILTIESSLPVSLSCEDFIKSFANQNARRSLLKLK